jgi:hypothetical protein
VDPLVALHLPQIDVSLGAYDYTIPALPAAAWLEAVLSTEGGSIVPGLLNEQDRDDVWADFADDAWTAEELAEVERDALGAAAGRPWWEADRLIRSAFTSDAWPIISGEMTHRGVDVHTISLSGWLNWVFLLIVTRCKDDAERTMFESRLSMPPPSVKVEELYDEEDAGAAFLAAMNEAAALGH